MCRFFGKKTSILLCVGVSWLDDVYHFVGIQAGPSVDRAIAGISIRRVSCGFRFLSLQFFAHGLLQYEGLGLRLQDMAEAECAPLHLFQRKRQQVAVASLFLGKWCT